jgi:hypothetical protein
LVTVPGGVSADGNLTDMSLYLPPDSQLFNQHGVAFPGPHQ